MTLGAVVRIVSRRVIGVLCTVVFRGMTLIAIDIPDESAGMTSVAFNRRVFSGEWSNRACMSCPEIRRFESGGAVALLARHREVRVFRIDGGGSVRSMTLIASGVRESEVIVHMTLHALEREMLTRELKSSLCMAHVAAEILLQRTMTLLARCRKTGVDVIGILRRKISIPMARDALRRSSCVLVLGKVLVTEDAANRRMSSQQRETRQFMFSHHIRYLPGLHRVAS
jgi:hypothetical protein